MLYDPDCSIMLSVLVTNFSWKFHLSVYICLQTWVTIASQLYLLLESSGCLLRKEM